MRSLKILGKEQTTSGPLIFFGKPRERARKCFPRGDATRFPTRGRQFSRSFVYVVRLLTYPEKNEGLFVI